MRHTGSNKWLIWLSVVVVHAIGLSEVQGVTGRAWFWDGTGQQLADPNTAEGLWDAIEGANEDDYGCHIASEALVSAGQAWFECNGESYQDIPVYLEPNGMIIQTGGKLTMCGTFYITGGSYCLTGGSVHGDSIYMTGGKFTQTDGHVGEIVRIDTLFEISGGTARVCTDIDGTVDNGGRIMQSGGNLLGCLLSVGKAGSGTITQSGGIADHDNLRLADSNSYAYGYYEITGGLATGYKWYIGESGTGSFVHNGSTATVAVDNLHVGEETGSTGVYTLTAGLLESEEQHIGYEGQAWFVQNGGTNSITSSSGVYVGSQTGGTGRYELTGGTLLPNELFVGNEGIGTFTQSGGHVGKIEEGSNSIYLTYNSSGSGRYVMSGGTVELDYISVGYNGPGTFVQSGGQVKTGTNGVISLGTNASSAKGRYELSGTGSVETGTLYVGDSRSGTFVHSGGLNTVSGTLHVGKESSATGRYELSGTGSTNIGTLYVGDNGRGTFAHSGGWNTVGNTLHVGYNSGAVGRYELSGEGKVSVPTLVVGNYNNSNGTMAQSGGYAKVSNKLLLAKESYSKGRYELTGGSLEVNTIEKGSGNGSFSFTGGTLQATTVKMDLTNGGGVMAPGGTAAVGTTTFTNDYDYTQSSSGKLNLTVSSLNSFDKIVLGTGTAAVDGELIVNCISSRPKQYDHFEIISTSGGSCSGDFATYTCNFTNGQDPNYTKIFTKHPGGGDDFTIFFSGFTAGDCMGDHDVDQVDLGILGGNWGKTGQTWQQGDFSGDGVVGLLDIGALAANWNWTGPPDYCPPQSVPEPACMALLGLGGLALIRRNRKR